MSHVMVTQLTEHDGDMIYFTVMIILSGDTKNIIKDSGIDAIIQYSNNMLILWKALG